MMLRRLAPFFLSAWAARSTVTTGLVLALALPALLHAQRAAKHAAKAPAPSAAAPVLMLSDIHFEPFQDPAKVAQLRAALPGQWDAILSAPPSATQSTDFQALQKTCPVRGVDTSWPLFTTALAQSSAQQPRPLFVTVSGDLLSHAFDCRFKALTPNATPEDLSAFAAKTIAFVTAELRQTFPDSPIYLALGNNDSGCSDYREDRNSPFLQHAAETFAAAAHNGDNGQAILHQFSDQGDYNIALPAPLHDARLLVLQDIFQSEHFAGCNGKPTPAADAAQLAWLDAQLADARAHHQRVWVMAHVPPGIDMYSTIAQHRNVCTGQKPAMFLTSEKLADILTAYPDVIALALFAHTHVDELRYLHAAGAPHAGSALSATGALHAAGASAGIPVKVVSSISPVNGNHPTFTVAQVDPHTAELLDYTVYLTGDGPQALKEYSFRETYKLPSFSSASLQTLTAGFLADSTGTTEATQAYEHFYFPGDTGIHSMALQLFWHSYACSLTQDSPIAFRVCACPAAVPLAK